jgi:hypothetical protein
MKSDETMIPHPKVRVQNFFQVAEIIFLLGRNKITLVSGQSLSPAFQLPEVDI